LSGGGTWSCGGRVTEGTGGGGAGSRSGQAVEAPAAGGHPTVAAGSWA